VLAAFERSPFPAAKPTTEERETAVQLSAEGLAQNQALFREVNERLFEILNPKATVSFHEAICECSDSSCTKSLAVTKSEYEAVRSNPKHFLVARGHELPELERTVFDNDRFLTVEKIVETEFMVASDPRSPGEEA
jgi:hypothetical protein